jgi:hypothetical protein
MFFVPHLRCNERNAAQVSRQNKDSRDSLAKTLKRYHNFLEMG